MLRNALRWLISRPDDFRATPFEIIKWWEIRRIPYNIIVGVVGIVSLVIFFVSYCASSYAETAAPGEDAVEPLALLAAPFIINFFYTAGWAVENIFRAVRVRNPKIGPNLWVIGTVFSILVVSLPGADWGLTWLWEGPANYSVPRSSIIGTYKVTHDAEGGGILGTETLFLRENGTYEQVFRPTAGGEWKNCGLWHVDRDENGNTLVVMDNRLEALIQAEDSSYALSVHPQSENDSLPVVQRRSEFALIVRGTWHSYKYKRIGSGS